MMLMEPGKERPHSLHGHSLLRPVARMAGEHTGMMPRAEHIGLVPNTVPPLKGQRRMLRALPAAAVAASVGGAPGRACAHGRMVKLPSVVDKFVTDGHISHSDTSPEAVPIPIDVASRLGMPRHATK